MAKKVKKKTGNGFDIKRFLKKIKKIFVRLAKKIRNFCVQKYNDFMDLPKHVRQIVYVWTVVILLVVILIVIGSVNKIKREEYKEYEDLMSAAALDYAMTKELYPIKTNKLRLQLDLLEDLGYLYEDDVKDETCDGFSLVSYDIETEEYTVDSYIKCKKYKSQEYDIYKYVESN